MSDVAIRVAGLGKQYHIGGERKAYGSLRESIVETLTAPFKRAGKLLRGEATAAGDLNDSFWALEDLNFEVKHGEVVGIIGHNGAGKSTLLKILSRITEPTVGYADIYGRVGSLLEVGTGFHQELTGRENVYLNGAILGMGRSEIDRKFDEIVDFAGIERFIDTPVKHYSSGMGLRLGFAVAAHLEPEILIVDEVLAVGDAEFQKKCLGKMDDVAQQGRTVLLVSHNMSAILSLCTSAIWLDKGKIHNINDPSTVIREYLDSGFSEDVVDLSTHKGRKSGMMIIFQTGRLINDKSENEKTIFKSGNRLQFEVDIKADPNILAHLNLGYRLTDALGSVISAGNLEQTTRAPDNVTGEYTFRVTIDKLVLTPGKYAISLYIGDGDIDLDVVINALLFDVIWDNALGYPPKPSWGPVLINPSWEFYEADGTPLPLDSTIKQSV